jgi:predicted AAA+ superfamily ATPase
MKRFIDQELLQWKHRKRRKPLIVRGARQVGKTYSIRSFGESHFDMFALADLEILLRQKIQPGKTLLFIDEIQACPRAITALRYLYEEMPDLHVIAAGSLLEFA